MTSSDPVSSPIAIIWETSGGNAQCFFIGSVNDFPCSNDCLDSFITLAITSFSTSFSSIVNAWRIGTELENIELNVRSEEHTSELQSRENLVCRLLLEKKKSKIIYR